MDAAGRVCLSQELGEEVKDLHLQGRQALVTGGSAIVRALAAESCVVAFISSPAASFVSGANGYVDGGAVAHVQF